MAGGAVNDDDPMLAAIEALAAMLQTVPRFHWGTVTQATPLLVHLDGDVDADGNPVTVAAQTVKTLTVGARVYCVEQDNRVIVIES
jgi:hypothetical protein